MSTEFQLVGHASVVNPEVATADLNLTYYIVESQIDLQELETVTYGIRIDLIGNDSVTFSSKTVLDVSVSRGRVADLVDLMQKNSVTPISLFDIIEDFI